LTLDENEGPGKDEAISTGTSVETATDDESPMRITSSDRGPGISFYKGRPGLWAYSLHRITGTAILLFLILHIADVAAVGWGREAYNTIHKLYETLFFRVLEVGLFGALLLHAINGVRIAIVDFWSEGAERQEIITAWAIVAFFVAFLPGATWMLYSYFAGGH
jgi:succinate dehydrogenase / fumarate reductase cytochrome b subunit